MAVHCQLLFATILYVLVFCNSIVELSTLLRGKSLVNGFCYLYVSDDSTSALSCNVILYACAGASIYAIVMAIYHGAGTYVASRDNHIGRTMWVMPWLLLNGLLVILTFICSCIYSAGLYITCSNYTKHFDKKISCSMQVKEFEPMFVAGISAWISVFLWICLLIIEGIRLRRNRRAISREVYVDPSTSDVVMIGKVEPSA